MLELYNAISYRDYLKFRFGGDGKRTGVRLAASKYLGCHTSLISQILKGTSHLSLEQAIELNSFFRHTKEEGEYFLTLVQRDRAGNSQLKNYFNEKLSDLTNQRMILKNRIRDKSELSDQERTKFYSSWIYGALHIMTSIPQFQSPESLATYLGIELNYVISCLEFLCEIELVQRNDSKYLMGTNHVHLGSDSHHIKSHHSNWRLKALQSLTPDRPNNAHYSSVMSLSREDFLKIRENLLEFLQQQLEVAKPSPAETACVFNFDLFEI